MLRNACCRWHAEHQELYVRKRIAVAEWRSQKDAQKAALAAEAYLEPATARQAQEQQRQQQQQDYSHMWVVAAMRFAAMPFAAMRLLPCALLPRHCFLPY